jgi:hypothetical protein
MKKKVQIKEIVSDFVLKITKRNPPCKTLNPEAKKSPFSYLGKNVS